MLATAEADFKRVSIRIALPSFPIVLEAFIACAFVVALAPTRCFTGMHHLRRVDILHDVGDSLNPDIDRGQIEGGFVQGAGWLTSEELKWSEQGRLQSHSASTYAIPTISDAPLDFRVNLLADAAQPHTIHGSKAVGEPPLMLAISVREALRDALAAFGSQTQFSSPLTPEVLKQAIGKIPL